MRRRTIVILGIVLALGTVGFVVARTRAAKPPMVTTEEARMGTLVSTVIETGSVESAAEVQVLPLVSARVARVRVAEGDAVKPGDVLIELDDASAASRVDVAKAAVTRAEAALAVQTRGAKPEEADVQRQAVANARTALAKAKAVLDATLASATSDANGTTATVRAASERLDVLVAKRADAAKTTSADMQTLDTQLDAAKNKVKRLEYQLERHQDGVDARVNAAEVARDNAAESVTAAQMALDDAAGSPADVLAKLEEALRQARAQLRTAEANLDTVTRAGELEMEQSEDQLQSAEEQRDQIRASRAATIAKTQATLNDLDGSIEQARKDLASQQAAADAQRATTEVKRKNAESAYAQAQAQLASAEAQLDLVTRTLTDVDLGVARADLASAKAQLADAVAAQGNYRLASPIAGTVTFVDATVGETVGPQTLVARVTDFTKLRIVMNISETEIAHVAVDQPAEITFDAFGDAQRFQGSVERIDVGPTIQQGVIFYQTRVALDPSTEAGALLPGMTATVTITTRETKDALIVPSRAVQQSDTGSTVKVQRKDGTLEVRPVTVGARGDDGVAITEGLRAGEKVVTFEKP